MRVILALVALGVIAWAAVFGAVCWRAGVARPRRSADCVVVLGARVYGDGRMSLVLRSRVDAALEAWKDGRAENIIVCGAQGADEPRSEAEAMAEFLIANGVPEESVFEDDRSYDTRQNIANAAEIMRQNGWESALIATSDYHVERALWMARDAGIEAEGVSAPTPKTPRAYWLGRLRESVSWVLYFLRII